MSDNVRWARVVLERQKKLQDDVERLIPGEDLDSLARAGDRCLANISKAQMAAGTTIALAQNANLDIEPMLAAVNEHMAISDVVIKSAITNSGVVPLDALDERILEMHQSFSKTVDEALRLLGQLSDCA